MTTNIQEFAKIHNKKSHDLEVIEIVFSEHLDKRCWLASDKLKRPYNPNSDSMEWKNSPLCTFSELQVFLSSTDEYLPCLVPSVAGLVVIDLDKIKQTEDPIPKWACELIQQQRSYSEISRSDTGIHIVIESTRPGYRVVGKMSECKIEFLEDHPVTLTGNIIKGFDTLRKDGSDLTALYHSVFPPKNEKPDPSNNKSPIMNDEQIIALCRRANNSEKFQSLFERGELSDYQNDHSSADLGLCSLLAFYTQDAKQLQRLFRKSALCQKIDRIKKWDREDYRDKTIITALEGISTFYQPPKSNHEESSQTTGSWEKPLPLPKGALPEISFPIDILPTELRDAALEISRFCSVDPAFAIAPLLGLIGLCIGKKATIIEKKGLQHYPSLFFVCVAPTGERKSSVFDCILDRFNDYIEKEEKPIYDSSKAQIKAFNDALDEKIAKTKKEIREGRIAEESGARVLTECYMQRKELPPSPWNFGNDLTPERLTQKLHTHSGVYAIFDADGRKFFSRIMGKGQQDGNSEEGIYLKAIWGDSIIRSRVGKSDEGEDCVIKKPALDGVTFIHPDVWYDFLKNPTMRQSGMLSRFCTIQPKSHIGTRLESENDQPLDEVVIKKYIDIAICIRKWSPQKVLNHPLDIKASKERRSFYNSLESELTAEGRYSDVVDLCGRAVSITARIALQLHIFKLAAGGNFPLEATEISIATWLQAQALEEYFLNTSIDMVRSHGPDSANHLLHKVDKWLRSLIKTSKNGEVLFTLGKLRNRVRGLENLSDTQILNDIVTILEKLGRIRKTDKQTVRGTVTYEVNPKIIKTEGENERS